MHIPVFFGSEKEVSYFLLCSFGGANSGLFEDALFSLLVSDF